MKMGTQSGLEPIARLDFVGKASDEPGWYIRYVVEGRPCSERLPIETGADAFGAVDLAASRLGCRVDQISVAGPVWPEPLDGMVDAEETLEFVPDLMPGLTDRTGEWRLVGDGRPQNDNHRPTYEHPRQSERRLVDGVTLFKPSRGRVINWSERGMGIEIDRPLRVSTRCLFEAEGKRSKLEHLGEVRWCRVVEGRSPEELALYRAGIALIG